MCLTLVVCLLVYLISRVFEENKECTTKGGFDGKTVVGSNLSKRRKTKGYSP